MASDAKVMQTPEGRAMPIRATSTLIAIVLVLSIVPCGRGDDIPDAVRSHYDEARQHLEAGRIKKAYSAIGKGKLKWPASVDFWELYVAIWRRMGKKEGILWERIIAKAEVKHPGSPVFHLLRHRLATDADARIAHLKTAMDTAPDALEPPALLAREYVRHGDGERAKALIDDVLARDPTHEMALALRGDLKLLKGRASSALEYAESHLAHHHYPALRDLVARALLALDATDAEYLMRAEQQARQALRARPEEWRFSLTLAEVLDRQRRSKEAKDLLDRMQAKTPAPEMAAKLGEFAFREGDYAKAAKGIGLHPRPDVLALKALVTCHTRLGDAKAARAALGRLTKGADDDLRRWAAARELELGDVKAVRRRLQRLEGETVDGLRIRAAGWEGNTAEAKRIGGQRARVGSRAAEEWLLSIVQAMLFEKLARRADGARRLLLDAAAKAARAGVAKATVPAKEPLLAAHTLGYIERHATYRRCLDGSFFEPLDGLDLRQRTVDDVMMPIATVEARSRCARDRVRFFPFRPGDKIREQDLQATMTSWLGEPSRQRWIKAQGGFAQGCAAILDRDYRQAQEALGRALEGEPGWGRARLFHAVAAALAGTDLEGAARDAERASASLIDDWAGRTAAILVRYLARQKVGVSLRDLAERRESFAARRYEDL